MFLWRDCRTRGGHSRDGATSDTVIEALSAAPLASRLGYTLPYAAIVAMIIGEAVEVFRAWPGRVRGDTTP